MRDRTDGDLLLLHGFEQGGLCLGWSSVDVSKEEVAEQGPGLEGEFSLLGVVDVRPGDVGWQQVRGELNTLEASSASAGVRHQGLRQSRIVLEEQLPFDRMLIRTLSMTWDFPMMTFWTSALMAVAIAPTAFRRSFTSGLDW